MEIPKSLIRFHSHCGLKDEVPEIVQQAQKYSPVLVKGFQLGNRTVVDKKSWLEVCDRKHRYGAYLRAYYQEWKRLNSPHSDFWLWLDNDSVELDGIPRAKLENETVLYCATNAERQRFTLDIVNGKIYQKNRPVDTDTDGWIFVLRDGVLYGGKKETERTPRVHHTSFVGGECVQAAGMMIVQNGDLKTLYPHSGHYRPQEREVLVLLDFLRSNKVPLENVSVDVQRIQKVKRDFQNGALVKKIHSAHFWGAIQVLSFLHVKHFAWSSKLFDELVCKLHL